MVHIALPKRPINQFKPVQKSRQQALRPYCPNIYTVPDLKRPSKTPSQAFSSRDLVFLNLRSPMGGSAYGIPWFFCEFSDRDRIIFSQENKRYLLNLSKDL